MISIIIPVYNVEKYLRCCLESVKNQTYRDIEVIMIDDGSTDNSFSICKEYADIDNRFKVIQQENKGLASARNTGIREAKGEYIYYIDSDDCINIRLLELLCKVADDTQANMVQVAFKDVPTDFSSYDEVDDNLDDDAYIKSHIKRLSIQECLYNLEISKTREEHILSLRTVVVWNKLYRRQAFDMLLFPEGMRLHEDQMVAHRNIISADGMVYVDIPLHYYRKAEGSLIRVGWTPKRLAIFDCYDDRLKWIEDLPDDLEGKNELYRFVSLRSLVCYYRNYEMATKKLTGREKKEVCKGIMHRFKHTLRDRKRDISVGWSIYFKLFSIFPSLVLAITGIRKRQ